MTVLTPEVRTLLGSEVDVETTEGTLHGTLLSCTPRSLWLVANESDLMVPLECVESVHPPACACDGLPRH
ncbi:MAG: hypothetical protein ABIV94_04715 [Acidimicrobiales bacterium]